MADLAWLTCGDFTGRVGDAFDLAGSTTGLELLEATESSEAGGRGPDGQERRQFSLVFRGAAVLPQATYRLRHVELGELDLFLVPIGPDEQGLRYQAAFA